MVLPTFFNLSLNLAIRSSWSEPQSAPGLETLKAVVIKIVTFVKEGNMPIKYKISN